MEELETEGKEKKSSGFLGMLKSFFAILATIVALVAVWVIFSCVDRKDSLKFVPKGYAAYVHTPSLWELANPLIDLKASDEILAMDDFKAFREPFLLLRENEIRESRIVQQLLSRRVDAAVYNIKVNGVESGESAFIALVDMGVLSAATRLVSLLDFKLKELKLGITKSEDGYVFEDKSSRLYLKPYHNLVIVSNNKSLFDKGLEQSAVYTSDERELMTKSGEKVRIVSDVHSLAEELTAGNELLSTALGSLLYENSFSTVAFDITNDKISLKAALPYRASETNPALQYLLSHKSTLPSLLTGMGDAVQYYTLLNLGSLRDMKEAFFPFFPKSQNIDATWSKADAACRAVFSMGLEDLLFSWTGNEFAVLGVEGQNDPAFALEIADETKRKEVFANIISSILVKSGANFILGGARLEQLKLPAFLNGVLSVFGVKLPSPYYMVLGNFVYFSESAETLSSIYSSMKDSSSRLAALDSWKNVSDGISQECSLSLFYNLEKSVPFFLRGNTTLAKILSLYNIGRCDIDIDGEKILLHIQSTAKESVDTSYIAGFPIALESSPTSLLEKETGEKSTSIFWTEGNVFIKAFDLRSLEFSTKQLSEKVNIVSTAQAVSANGVLWAVSENGAVYLLDKKLNVVPNFPILLGQKPSAPPSALGNAVVVPLEFGALAFVDDTGKAEILPLGLNGKILNAPAVLGDKIAVYDKSFRGQVITIENKAVSEVQNLAGIAFGSPALLETKDGLYTAMITQSGNLSVWKNGEILPNFPIKLDGNFKTSVVAGSNCFYCLSNFGSLYKIALNGAYVRVDIAGRTAENGGIFTEDENVFIYVDANVIYGFDSSLELLSKFPLSGFGKCAFIDVNGDKKKDCVVLGLDKKIYAWNAR